MAFRAVRGHKGNASIALREREFEKLYREAYSSVYNFVFYSVLDQEKAQDIVSESFMRAAKYFYRFDDQKASFPTWVKSIARNCISDYFKKNKVNSDIDSIKESFLAEKSSAIDSLYDTEYITYLLNQLTEEDRQIVYLRFHEGYRNKEIADELGINESTIASRLSRSLKRLREFIEKSDDYHH